MTCSFFMTFLSIGTGFLRRLYAPSHSLREDSIECSCNDAHPQNHRATLYAHCGFTASSGEAVAPAASGSLAASQRRLCDR